MSATPPIDARLRSVGAFFHQTNWTNERAVVPPVEVAETSPPAVERVDPRSKSVAAFFESINWANAAAPQAQAEPENPLTVKFIMSQFQWD